MLTSCDRPKLGDKGLRVYQILRQHLARDKSGLTLAQRKDTTCFLRWIMSVMPATTVQACSQNVTGKKKQKKGKSQPSSLTCTRVLGSLREMVRGSLWRTMESLMKYGGSPSKSSARTMTCIVTWLWQKIIRSPRSGGSTSTYPW